MTVYIAPSVYRSLNVQTAVAIQKAISSAPLGERIIWEPMWGDALISRSRSTLATKFFREIKDADVMVIIDDDIVFQPDDLWKIIAGARDTKGIYGAVYVTHGEKPHLTCRQLPGTPDIKVNTQSKSDPIEVEYIATGFMAIHRNVIDAMSIGEYRDADGFHKLHLCARGSENGVIIPFFDTMTVEEAPGIFHWLSEDWAFCERARQLRFKCWIDQSILLYHVGFHNQSVNDLLDAGTGTSKVEVTIPLSGEPIIDTLPDDLAEWTGQSLPSVYAAIQEGTAVLAKQWSERSVSEEEWYKLPQTGAAYALDLTYWHMNGGGVPRQYAPLLKGKSVLDFGAGIGTFSLMAAREGATVFVEEINDWMREFTWWRSQKYGLKLYLNLEEQVDAVVCWHVFEHVSNPVFLLEQLKKVLKSGGLLITQSDFCIDDDHPQHHTFDDWEGALLKSGFILKEPNIYLRL